MHTMWIILQAHPTTHNLINLLKCMYRLWKVYFTKQKRRGNYLFKCLMIYHNTPLSGSLQSQMQILQCRGTRSDLPLSNAAGQQLHLQLKKLTTVNKKEHFLSHDIHIAQDVMLPKCYKQEVVSSHYYQLMCAAKKV